jgi:hypothetical protein
MSVHKPQIPPLTDEQEAEIQRKIASDPDSPEATDEELASAPFCGGVSRADGKHPPFSWAPDR